MRVITGKYKGRHFEVPRTFKARPTTDFAKENLFNVLTGHLSLEGATALDLFSGTGSITLELLSRGCRQVTSVELDRQHHAFIVQCLKHLAVPPTVCRALRADALRYIRQAPQQYDLVFADPPYALPQLAEIPDRVMQSRLLATGALLVLEHGAGHDFSQHPCFVEHRAYGSVNFSIFKKQPHNPISPTHMKNIVIFGAPGSGKGTQSDLLIERYGLGHISTGDVLRAEISRGTDLGRTARQFIDQGQLIPDDLMVSILAKVYDGYGKDHPGVIFDGFPRTIPQAEALKAMLAERGHAIAAMIELDVPEDELMQRLLLRGQQSGRADDNEETIRKRLVVYHQQTQPLIGWYRQEGLHHHIDGLGDLQRIAADISAVVDAL